MPANSEETLLPIMGSLEASVMKEVAAPDLSLCSKTSSRQVLMQKILFLPAERSCHSQQLERLRAKYTPLNARSSEYSPPKLVAHYKCPENIKMSGDDLPAPKVILFPQENVRHEWQDSLSVGAGLVNMGNTCFLNSTLQCLTYTAPLVNYLMGDDHCKICKLVGFCMLCELHQHIKSCFKQSGRIEPRSIVDKLQVIAKHMHLGRQEDAQEFLRYVVDRMQEACLNGHKQLDYVSKQTTAVSQIFGGYLRSQVVCLKCKAKSNTYEMFMDISLDIENAPSVIKAFEKYTQPEKLDIDNAYNCTECRQKVMAEKKFTIHKAPNVLTIQLKRFDYFRHLAKVTRHVKFSEELDLQPFMSSKEQSPVPYELYAVLVHSGYACTSGHYYCYIKAPNSMWYCMNDQHVTQVSINRVLNAEAYLLFYKRVKSKVPNISEVHPTEQKPASPSGKLATDTNSSVEVDSSTQTSVGTCSNKLDVEEIILQPKQESESLVPTSKQPPEIRKPRLVMRIRNGAVCYNSANDLIETNHCDSTKNQHTCVPYNDRSSEEERISCNCDPGQLTGIKFKSGKRPAKKVKQKNEPVIDQCLETTTSVPGCYAALDKMASWMAARKLRRVSGKDKSSLPMVNKIKDLRKTSNDAGSAPGSRLPKVNATSKWNIWNSGACLSPSVTSSSNISSINSKVTDNSYQVKQQRAHVPKFKHFGWTSTRKKMEKPKESRDGALVEKVLDLSAYDFHEEESTTPFSFSRTRSLIKLKISSPVEQETSSHDLPSRHHKKHKKKKKHKKHKKHYRDELAGFRNEVKAEKISYMKKWREHKKNSNTGEVASSWADNENVTGNSYVMFNQKRVTHHVNFKHPNVCDENKDLNKRCGQWSSQTRIKRIKICHGTENSDDDMS